MCKFILMAWLLLLSFAETGYAGSPSCVQPLLLYKVEQDPRCRQWVDSVMGRLSLREQVGQLFIYTLSPTDTGKNGQLLRQAVDTYKVGGLLFSGGKMQTQAELTNRAQRMARIPLMITFDGEWGLSMRLKGTPVFPRNMTLGCIRDNRLLYEYGREMARQCRELGVQVNFAPVADVNINPRNPVINTRSFGQDPIRVADKVIAYATGLEGGRVLSVCKHFPGHGDTDVDSHRALPVLPFSRERLDSVELYPFKEAIRAGVGGIMVGHLQVPVFDLVGGLPSSLSRNVVYGLLSEELAFRGLIFTDALAMKGVADHTSVSLQALKAGNDMVLAPHNLESELESVMKAIERGELTRADVKRKCRKVLTYKYALGLTRKPFVALSGLGSRINTPQTRDLIRRLDQAAITVLSNRDRLLPLHTQKGALPMALLEVGEPGESDALAERLMQYTPLVRFRLKPHATSEEGKALRDSLKTYRRLLVSVTEQRLGPYQSFFAALAAEQQMPPALYLFFAPGKMMLQIGRAITTAGAVVLAHTPRSEVQQQVADVLFAHATADGTLSASIGSLFATGAGVTITPHTPRYYRPEEYGMLSEVLQRIDSIAQEGIAQGAYPGCQIVVMRHGRRVYDRCFGTFAGLSGVGKHSTPVRPTSLYDLASLSKTTGTLLALMKLYDRGRFNLTDRLSDHLSWMKRTNKREITIRELLLHQSGLPAGMVLYPELIDKGSYKGSLFASHRDATHPLELAVGTWANPDFRFKSDLCSTVRTPRMAWQVADSLWISSSIGQTAREKIARLPLGPKQYLYSDVGFLLLGLLAEQLAAMPLNEYVAQEFYEPMGLERTLYLPLNRFSKKEIVPSAHDRFLRKQVLQGFVHDETAAFWTGAAGNAGLFSTARDVAQLYQMLLNGGELDGRRYLSNETCTLFTTQTATESRRGLGFDRSSPSKPLQNPCAPLAPTSVYGHTGFTGTCAWADPDNELVYVFLSNRTYPDAANRKLIRLRIREKIQQVVYESLDR